MCGGNSKIVRVGKHENVWRKNQTNYVRESFAPMVLFLIDSKRLPLVENICSLKKTKDVMLFYSLLASY